MDNCPMHNSDDISSYVVERGYRYIYLPPYSTELNPIHKAILVGGKKQIESRETSFDWDSQFKNDQCLQ